MRKRWLKLPSRTVQCSAVRSPREISFRLRQELGNLAMFLLPPPEPGAGHARSSLLPDPAVVACELRDTPYALEVERIAEEILRHRFPILGVTIDTGPEIDWRRDYLHGITTGTPYFRRSPYLDFSRAGDHKVIWEFNRHQHLVLLAQAFLLSGRRAYLDEVFRQLESWLDANPFLRGINWASALEVAFRALSWCWLWHMAGGEMSEGLRARFLTALERHGRYLELNLSVYFSPNTHLLGEAVVLHALGVLFPAFARARHWVREGGRIVEQELRRQVRADGTHFEQSAYYHVYALDFLLLYRVLAGPGGDYDERVKAMAEYLDGLLGVSGILPLIGDDDGGRLFHPYGERVRFGLATMATCGVLFNRPDWLRGTEFLQEQAAWWLGAEVLRRPAATPGPRGSRLFADAGTAIMAKRDVQLVVKAGPFGEGSGGHSHSDALSLTARLGNREILIDPGTFTYIADPAERNRFRGSAAHNTVRVDERDQAIPAGPFRWSEKPVVRVDRWAVGAESDYLDATCVYGGLTHRRRVLFLKPSRVVILDSVDGPEGERLVEQFWHLDSPADAARLSFSAPAISNEGWRSRALCSREPATVLCVTLRGVLPIHIAAVLDLSDAPTMGALTIRNESGDVIIARSANSGPMAVFHEDGSVGPPTPY
ncbi:MAG: alginate lyase family protein [Candidatus Solibacter sp.]